MFYLRLDPDSIDGVMCPFLANNWDFCCGKKRHLFLWQKTTFNFVIVVLLNTMQIYTFLKCCMNFILK